jgi:hypothetical protein
MHVVPVVLVCGVIHIGFVVLIATLIFHVNALALIDELIDLDYTIFSTESQSLKESLNTGRSIIGITSHPLAFKIASYHLSKTAISVI